MGPITAERVNASFVDKVGALADKAEKYVDLTGAAFSTSKIIFENNPLLATASKVQDVVETALMAMKLPGRWKKFKEESSAKINFKKALDAVGLIVKVVRDIAKAVFNYFFEKAPPIMRHLDTTSSLFGIRLNLYKIVEGCEKKNPKQVIQKTAELGLCVIRVATNTLGCAIPPPVKLAFVWVSVVVPLFESKN